MKILTIAEQFPFPADDGTKIQIYERIRALSAAHHEVVLLVVTAEDISENRRAAMERYCQCIFIKRPHFDRPRSSVGKVAKLAFSIITGHAYFLNDTFSPALGEKIEELTKTQVFDVVESDTYGGRYLRHVRKGLRVCIFHSVFHSCHRREMARTQGAIRKAVLTVYGRLTEKFEKEMLKHIDLCVTLTQNDCIELQKLYPASRVRHCLSNGVDLEYFAFDPPVGTPKGACFVGKMDYSPNVEAVTWFSKAVLPIVRKEVPEFQFSIVGGAPTEAVKALANLPNVTVTGYVEDVRAHMRDMGIVVVPIRLGGGISNKLLQAFACGVPVIATANVLDGTSCSPGHDLIEAETPDEFASAILDLLNDAGSRQYLSQNGRAYVEQNHRWHSSVRRYVNEINQCVAKSDDSFDGSLTHDSSASYR
jgi:glycosyltransferase involved in cell wall biosynthesis